MDAHTKPVTLLRLMAERKGQRITQRDLAVLELAAATLESQAEVIGKQMRGIGNTLSDLVTAEARAKALTEGMRALLEIHT